MSEQHEVKPDAEELRKSKNSLVESCVFDQATLGKGATFEQALTIFSNPDNWRFEHLEKDGKVTGGAWIWQGNWRPPWEFAMHSLRSGEAR